MFRSLYNTFQETHSLFSGEGPFWEWSLFHTLNPRQVGAALEYCSFALSRKTLILLCWEFELFNKMHSLRVQQIISDYLLSKWIKEGIRQEDRHGQHYIVKITDQVFKSSKKVCTRWFQYKVIKCYQKFSHKKRKLKPTKTEFYSYVLT